MADGNDRNWNALLKWSLAQTDDGNTANVRDGDGAAAPRVISEADRAWFLQAMQNGMVDEIKRMKAIAAAIGPNADKVLPSQEDIDARLELMHELNDRVCSVDNGGDLHTIGGLVPVVSNLSSPHAPLRAAAAEIVGTTVQNHQKAQLAAVECGAVAPLLRLVLGEGGDAEPSAGDARNGRDGSETVGFESEDSGRKAKRLAECRVKALLGLSSVTRGCPRAVAEFFKLGGAKSVARCVEETTLVDTTDGDALSLRHLTLKAKTKALHLARHLCVMSDKTMSIVIDADFVSRAASALAEAVPSFGALGTSWSDAFRRTEKQTMSVDAILGSQLREASLRLLLDIARCVDFAKEPKALDQLRGQRVVDAINVVGRWYATFDADEKSTFQDEMTVCADLAKMFG
jgi:hsp70-interacting protein